MKKINAAERTKMVKAMEFIARQINDEEVFECWLMDGVDDGGIAYGDLDCDPSGLEYWVEDDENFADLMDMFLRVMKAAFKSGGLYCDSVVSKVAEY